MFSKVFKVQEQNIGLGQTCFIIAEAGVNHNGNLDLAIQLIDAAVEAGADAIKFQTFKTERLVTPSAQKADYQRATTGASESQFAMLKRLELNIDAHRILLAHCREKRIIFMSTPFDEESADLLDELGVPIFKIASGEITNIRLLRHIARKGKPMIVSTGMSYLSEVEAAVRAIEDVGNPELILLHAVSNYPADPADINLHAMETMFKAFGTPVGYSDHTAGLEVSLAAVALGACVIEKHFTLDRSLPGPDHSASLEPAELKKLVNGIRTVESALGHGRKVPVATELSTAAAARRSLVVAFPIPAGTIITDEMLTVKRPGTGLPPGFRNYLIGRKARVDIPADILLTLDMFI
jgi:N-acetylneuraminate synthase